MRPPFTSEDVVSQAQHFWSQELLRWNLVISSDELPTEDRIAVYRAERTAYKTVLFFWLDAAFDDFLRHSWDSGLEHIPTELLEECFAGFISQITDRTMEFSFLLQTEAETQNQLMYHCKNGEVKAYELNIKGKFLSALQMDSKWNKRSLLIETDEEFIFFCWMTTA